MASLRPVGLELEETRESKPEAMIYFSPSVGAALAKRDEAEMWLSQVEFESDAAEAIFELAPRAYAGHVHAAVSEERARKGGQEDGQAMRVMLRKKRESSRRRCC